jgi:hypothetical protein
MNSLDPFFYTELHIEVASDLKLRHEHLRTNLETCLGESWRITKITEISTSAYDAMLATRTTSNPVYTRFQVLATFLVEAIENGALDRIVDGFKVSIPRKTLCFKAELLSNGHLQITESDMEFPTE